MKRKTFLYVVIIIVLGICVNQLYLAEIADYFKYPAIVFSVMTMIGYGFFIIDIITGNAVKKPTKKKKR